MPIDKIEGLEDLSRAIKHQASIKMLKNLIEGDSQVLIKLNISVSGVRKDIGSVSFTDLTRKQTLDMIDSLLSVNKKIIHELKPVMEQIFNKEE